MLFIGVGRMRLKYGYVRVKMGIETLTVHRFTLTVVISLPQHICTDEEGVLSMGIALLNRCTLTSSL
jgi:hypothetical protein